SASDFNENSFEIFVEDPISGKTIKLRVEGKHSIKQIVDIITKHLGSLTTDERTYGLVLRGKELPPWITIEDAIHEFGLKEGDKFSMWAKIKGAAGNLQELEVMQNDAEIENRRRIFLNFLDQNAKKYKTKTPFILAFEYNLESGFTMIEKKMVNELNSEKEIRNFLDSIDSNEYFLAKGELYVENSKSREIKPKIHIDFNQLKLIKDQIIRQIQENPKLNLNYLKGIESEIYNNLYKKFNKDFTNKYLKNNIFDTVMDYFINYELMANIWAQYSHESGSFDLLKDEYLRNWENNDDVKKLQRLFWGILLDFRHPLKGQKMDPNKWMSFPLHHWKTAGGHENKFECFWSAVIPLPDSTKIGEPTHNDIGRDVDKHQKGYYWEKEFENVITSILKGDLPKAWKDHLSIEEQGIFRSYSESIEDIRELINTFLS
ncbi:MAG: hypothetical protein ACFFB8_18150, partial [Promethearchaeota archaeon]